MRRHPVAEELGSTDLLAGLGPMQRQSAMAILMRGGMERWRTDQIGPLRTGSARLLLVKSGTCEVIVTTQDGRPFVLAEAGAGEVLTCAPAGLEDGEVALHCVDEAVLCPIDQAHLEALASHPTVLLGLIEQATRRAEEAQAAALRLAHRRVEDRVLLALRSLAARHGRVTARGIRLTGLRHQDIARRANVTRPGATQALARLEQGGSIVRAEEGAIYLVSDEPREHGPTPSCQAPEPRVAGIKRLLRRPR